MNESDSASVAILAQINEELVLHIVQRIFRRQLLGIARIDHDLGALTQLVVFQHGGNEDPQHSLPPSTSVADNIQSHNKEKKSIVGSTSIIPVRMKKCNDVRHTSRAKLRSPHPEGNSNEYP